MMAYRVVAESGSAGSADGAMYTKYKTDNTIHYCTSYDDKYPASDGIGISASRSSGLYSGSKMQPKALAILPCIRF